MNKILIGLLFSLISVGSWAQNPIIPEQPVQLSPQEYQAVLNGLISKDQAISLLLKKQRDAQALVRKRSDKTVLPGYTATIPDPSLGAIPPGQRPETNAPDPESTTNSVPQADSTSGG